MTHTTNISLNNQEVSLLLGLIYEKFHDTSTPLTDIEVEIANRINQRLEEAENDLYELIVTS